MVQSVFQPYYMVLKCGHLTLRFWLIWKDARFGSSKSYYIFQNLRIICLCILEICNMRSIQSEIDYRKLLFVARLILIEHGNLISEMFKCRVKSYFVDTSCSIRFVKEVVQLLNKYDLSHHFTECYHTGFFCPTMNGSKRTVKQCIENMYWTEFAISHESV